MREYSKTDNLYKRNPKKKSELLVGEYTRPEFALINSWWVTEKVDGTNVRLWFDKDENTNYGGRTDNAQFSPVQQEFMSNLVDSIREDAVNLIHNHGLNELLIFGELYGPKILSGGNYSDSLDFRAFDMMVNDRVWLNPDSVNQNASDLGLKMVPNFGMMTTAQIFLMVAGGFKSTFAKNPEFDAEGVIAQPPVNLYDQRGERVKFKLKTKDLRHV
ncbi:RNA ligase [Streptomyces phage Belfort]|uniref:RNA ligase n=1 Tax=Streptomyces phage Belfort TaxID=2801887 RepID=A0A7T8C3W9_9CAUD|nr:RNA ligase [Streptomyces phage Belfort]